MARDIWTDWTSIHTWDHPERAVFFATGHHRATVPSFLANRNSMSGADAARHTSECGLRHAVVDDGAIAILLEKPAELRQWQEDPCPRFVPALYLERNLPTEALQPLVEAKAAHRALVVSPRQSLELGLVGILPGDWLGGGIGYQPLYNFVDLVIVRGPTGPDAWPMHPAWVRGIQAECAQWGVAFAFTGWGHWKPTYSAAWWQENGKRTEEAEGLAMLADGRILFRDEAAGVVRAPWEQSGRRRADAIVCDQDAVECMRAAWRRSEQSKRPVEPPYDEHTWFYRAGAEHSGRGIRARNEHGELAATATEHLNLPEGL